ncbi:MAG TPA: hypothetical protein DCS67_03530, partial [Clostridiales bacterium UBA8960]|nr:hypothetical protein [Clostridiales bacterium UBA8960]
QVLKSYNVQKDIIKIVVEAIKKHNIKNKIDEPYSELIKDADALAHYEEGILSDEDAYEWARIKATEMVGVTVSFSETEKWIEAFETHFTDFIESWNLDAFDSDPLKWIHSTRIKIRKVRSLIQLFSKSGMGNRYNEVDKRLKRAFKLLAEARMVHVMMVNQETLSDLVNHKSLEPILDEKLKRIRKDVPKITFDRSRIEIPYVTAFEEVIKKELNLYFEKASRLDFDDVKQVHKVRILGKTVKDWFAMGLIHSTHTDLVDAVEVLHKQLGTFNDLHDIMALAQFETYFDKKKVKQAAELTQKKSMESLFVFKLMKRKTKNKTVVYPSIMFAES